MMRHLCLLATLLCSGAAISAADERPNIILLMADDQGWGQTGYYNHPVLKTPNLDAMAESGLRFDRFYAGASNCSPTRATVLTGRSNDRTGVFDHGYPLRAQERTFAQALRTNGYATAHFGKWHLNGLRGPGAPILEQDALHPGHFGFDAWLSATNFIDFDPLLSRAGEFEDFRGDSSEVIIAEAIKFIASQSSAGKPFLTVVWYGTPHSPWRASSADREPFKTLDEDHQHHYGELVAMDRSIGALRSKLRELGIADNTLVWYCSDNGGLKPFGPETVGNLRGWKNTLYEGGIRVPAIIEWPAQISQPRATSFPGSTLDIFPTLADVAGLPNSVMLQPQDGISLLPTFKDSALTRAKPIPFRHRGRLALVDNQYKLIQLDAGEPVYQLYHLVDDPAETTDVSEDHPEIAQRLKTQLAQWARSVDASVAGDDYPEGRVLPSTSERRFWTTDSAYEPYLNEWAKRPEYRAGIEKARDEAVKDADPQHGEKIQLPEGWKWDQPVPGRASRQGDAIQLDTVNGRVWAGEGNQNRIITASPIGDKAMALANVELVDAAGKWEQCGLLACHNDDSFVKLVLEHIDGKHHVIMAWEIDGKRKVLALLEIPTSRAYLRMDVDGDTVRGFWRSDPSQTWNPVAETKLTSDPSRYFMLFTQDGDPAKPRHALVRELSWLKGK